MADDGAEQKVRAVVEKVKLFTLNKEEFELTIKLTVEQRKQSDILEKYLLDNHIDIYCRTKRTHIKEWVLNQNKDEKRF